MVWQSDQQNKIWISFNHKITHQGTFFQIFGLSRNLTLGYPVTEAITEEYFYRMTYCKYIKCTHSIQKNFPGEILRGQL